MSLVTTVANVGSVWMAKIYVNNNSGVEVNGRSYSHCVGVAGDLPGVTSGFVGTTPPDITDLVKAYRSVMGLNSQAVWATVSATRPLKGTYPILKAPVGPLARTGEDPVGDINAGGDSVVFRLECASGKRSIHSVSFVRDDEIDQDTFTIDVSAFTPGAGNLKADPTTATAAESWKNFMQRLLDLTQLASKKNGVWTCERFTDVFVRGVRAKYVGRGFLGAPRRRKT